MGFKNRIVIVDSLSWIPGESGQGTGADGRFIRWLETDKDPCGPRNFKATPEWAAVDLGWLKGEPISFLHFANLEGTGLLVNPSKDEKERMAGLTLEIALSEAAAGMPLLCRPGSHVRVEIAGPQGIRVRCPNGICKYALTVFPN